MKINILIQFKILMLSILTGCFGQPELNINNNQIRQIVERNTDSVDVNSFFPDKDVRTYLHKEFNEFYKNRNYELAWLSFDKPKETADELLFAIDNADKEGLSSEHYNLRQIESLLKKLYNIESRKERRKEWRKKLIKSKKFKQRFQKRDSVLFNNIVKLDLLMTATYLTYSSHLLSGRINPNETADWYSEPRRKDLSNYLENAITERDIHQSLLKLNPPHEQYDKLKEMLVKYKKIAENGGWKKFLIDKNLKPGDTDPAIVKLRQRLHREGFIVNNVESKFYDKSIEDVIKSYQMLHGLEINGAVDEATKQELNKPVEEIIHSIAFNMERLRWIHGPFGDHYVLVNIPAFEMRVVKNNKVKLKMKAIVGETVNKTPVFNDSLEYIVFSPEWVVPRSIAVNEMLPGIKREPNYLASHNFKLFNSWDKDATPISQQSVNWSNVTPENFNFRIVEKPGPKNSLGKVKFIFPNSKNIYLHDTPADHLFSQNERDFSHGCIRLEKPEEFAAYLLQDKGWTPEDISRYMNKGKPSTVLLGEKIPVYIVYWTTWVDENNNLHLRKDIYNYDRIQMDKMEEKDKALKAVL